jgi:hypothetical protein
MKKLLTNKYALAAIVLGGALLAWYLYQRRWKKFSDNGQSGILNQLAGGSDIGGGLGIVSNEPHGLKVGDVVEIEQEPGAKWPSYDGEALVSHVISETVFAVDKPFKGNSPVNPGKYRKK